MKENLEQTNHMTQCPEAERQHRLLSRVIVGVIMLSALSILISWPLELLTTRSTVTDTLGATHGKYLIIILCIPAGRAIVNAVVFCKSGRWALAAPPALTFFFLLAAATFAFIRSE